MEGCLFFFWGGEPPSLAVLQAVNKKRLVLGDPDLETGPGKHVSHESLPHIAFSESFRLCFVLPVNEEQVLSLSCF